MLGRRLRAYLWTLLGTARAFKAAGRFDERLPRLQDLDYFLRFIAAGGTLVVPPGNEHALPLSQVRPRPRRRTRSAAATG